MNAKIVYLLAKITGKAEREARARKERDAAEGLRILERAIEHLEQYGTGNDLEESHARIILHGRIDAIWSEFGVERKGSPARVG
jgi:hypothetical protein